MRLQSPCSFLLSSCVITLEKKLQVIGLVSSRRETHKGVFLLCFYSILSYGHFLVTDTPWIYTAQIREV